MKGNKRGITCRSQVSNSDKIIKQPRERTRLTIKKFIIALELRTVLKVSLKFSFIQRRINQYTKKRQTFTPKV